MQVGREVDEPSGRWRQLWTFPAGLTYLNHGSFGPAPLPVRQAQQAIQEQLNANPMDFFVGRFESLLTAAGQRLAGWLGAAAENLVFVENATAGMNAVAAGFRLAPGDEVLLTDHEYGAVRRIWQRACLAADAKVETVPIRVPIESDEAVVEAIVAALNPRTRLLVVSHVTSPTALTLPVAAICRAARQRGVSVCVDGPHALANLDLRLAALGCDYYTASCHKWLSAPFGSGFLYVRPDAPHAVEQPLLSWGRLLPAQPKRWSDEFIWPGTRDPSPYLAVPAAIEFLEWVGVARYREHTRGLAEYARQRIATRTGCPALATASPWRLPLVALPLAPGAADSAEKSRALQSRLRQEDGIEVPIVRWNERTMVRVSCHLYNTRDDVDRLVDALDRLGALGRVA